MKNNPISLEDMIKLHDDICSITTELLVLRSENILLKDKITLLEKLEDNRSELICKKCGVRQDSTYPEEGDW